MMSRDRTKANANGLYGRIFLLLSVLMGCALPTVAGAEPPATAPATAAETAPADRELSPAVTGRMKYQKQWEEKQRVLKESLEKPIEGDAFEAPLEEVLKTIAETNDVAIIFERVEFENLGVDVDSPVTITLNDVPLRLALDHILAPFDIAYYAENGLLCFTSIEDAEQQVVTRFYCVRDLLFEQAPHQSAERLQLLLMDVVDPDSWDRNGGLGTIVHYQGVFVVLQTDRLQDKCLAVIESLRAEVSQSGGPTLHQQPTRRTPQKRPQTRSGRRAPSPNRDGGE